MRIAEHPLIGKRCFVAGFTGRRAIGTIGSITTLYEPIWTRMDGPNGKDIMGLTGSKIETYIVVLHDDGSFGQYPYNKVSVTMSEESTL